MTDSQQHARPRDAANANSGARSAGTGSAISSARSTYSPQVSHVLPDPHLPPGRPQGAGATITGTGLHRRPRRARGRMDAPDPLRPAWTPPTHRSWPIGARDVRELSQSASAQAAGPLAGDAALGALDQPPQGPRSGRGRGRGRGRGASREPRAGAPRRAAAAGPSLTPRCFLPRPGCTRLSGAAQIPEVSGGRCHLVPGSSGTIEETK